jgi:hypothetical protein
MAISPAVDPRVRSASERLAIILLAVIFVCTGARASGSDDHDLVQGFQSPPVDARPRVWWHWMNGNVTEEGVRLDLEWMKRIGIAGAQNFDGDFWGAGKDYDTPLIVAKPIGYLTPQWQQVFRHSVALAAELGLEFAIASSPGWTTTGGPWVPPEDAMKKLVWTETRIRGGRPFRGRIEAPRGITGPFQTIPVSKLDEHWRVRPPLTFYRDVATIAYRAPRADKSFRELHPDATSSAGLIVGTRLYGDDLGETVELSFKQASEAWVQFDFRHPQRIQALTLAIDRPDAHPLQLPLPRGSLEASDDGKTFHRLIELPQTGYIELSSLQQTITFAPVSARFFRLVLTRPDNKANDDDFTYRIAEFTLHTAAHVNRFEDKAGFSTRQIVEADDTPGTGPDSIIKRSDVVDLTQELRSDGSLHWTPPPGRWVVLRFGYSLTGKLNDPACPTATGLEVDKLDPTAVQRYLTTYLGYYQSALGSDLIGSRGLRALVVDSYEAGPQNWTPGILTEFKARRGYDLRPWMPVLAGYIVESAEASDKVLWDFRKTLGELMRDAHYEQLSVAAHAHGLIRYGESHEWGRFLIGDGMEMKRSADVPMGAMWMDLSDAEMPNYIADLEESASVAHLYGKRFVAAESFATDGSNPYGYGPEDLKPVADRIMLEGINRFVIHTSVHQPDRRSGPGLGLGPIGQWFTRKETWAEQAAAWIDYLARSSYLLQQGRYVADIAILYGEDTNLTSRFHTSGPSVPPGYRFDFVNPDALVHEMFARGHELLSHSGMRYRVLSLDSSTSRMSLPVLRKIGEFVKKGVVIAGLPPRMTPSFADDPKEFRRLVTEIWGKSSSSIRNGNVHRSLAAALAAATVAPDVRFPTSSSLRFLHRTLDHGDIYFIANLNTQPESVVASFRVSGRRPELWRADSGTRKPLSYRMEGDRTSVPLALDAHDAIFVLFRDATRDTALNIPARNRSLLTIMNGPWDVSFPVRHGGTLTAHFDTLRSWTDRGEPDIRYFSGTASYTKHFTVDRLWLDGHSRIEVDLGTVKDLAALSVNGEPQGIVWKAPFATAISNALKVGDNRLDISVTNLWPNQLIGDKQPGVRAMDYASYDPFRPDSSLLPSGLLGPVTLWKVTDSTL